MNTELLAPAGNLESFITAIENGADSIYLGLKKFNARKPATNFTIYQLKQVLETAKKKHKKIYLTLNIDLKFNELKEIAQILELVKQLKVNAIILKDPAIVYLIQKVYRDIAMHYSTQNTIESSLGVDFAKTQGAKRIILARELELHEIQKACSINGMECEIFTEGSMCFSISGKCLMSSWVGGRSGNRGCCTAPCRVPWTNNNKSYPYFSMKDLSLISYLNELTKTNVAAFKIEGRLKKPLWIKEIISGYKKALKNLKDIDTFNNIYKELKKHSARELASGHVFGHNSLIGENKDWNLYQKNKISFNNNSQLISKNEITIALEKEHLITTFNLFNKTSILNVKISPKPKKSKLVTIEKISQYLTDNAIIKKIDINFNKINVIFSQSFLQKTAKLINSHIHKLVKEEEKLPQLNKEILDLIQPKKQIKKRGKLLGTLPNKIIIFPQQIPSLLNSNFILQTIVISLNSYIDIPTVKNLGKKYKLILSIPDVLFENEANKMQKYILKLIKNNFTDFEANSYTGMRILNNIKCNKYIGTSMTVMNHLSAKYFYELGFKSLYTAIEGDQAVYKSLSDFSPGNIECLVFGKLPLFQSRVESPVFKSNSTFKDKLNIEIECFNQKHINTFIATTPFSLLGKSIEKEAIYFDSLTADLRYFKNAGKVLNSLHNNHKFNTSNTSTFNFYKRLI